MYGWKVTHVEVQAVGVNDIVIDNLDIDSREKFHELPQLGTSNTIGAINGQVTLDLDSPHDLLEGLCELLVVTLLAGLTILVLRSQSVLATHNVVELRSGHVLEVDELDIGGGKRGIEHAHQAGTRSASVTSKDDAGRVGHLHIDLLGQLVINIGNGLQRRIGQLGCVLLPFSLNWIVRLGIQIDWIFID